MIQPVSIREPCIVQQRKVVIIGPFVDMLLIKQNIALITRINKCLEEKNIRQRKSPPLTRNFTHHGREHIQRFETYISHFVSCIDQFYTQLLGKSTRLKLYELRKLH